MTDNKFPSPTGHPIASREHDTVVMVRDADGEPMRALDAEMPETIYIELVKSEKLGGYMMKHFDTKKSFDSGTKYIRADKSPIFGGDVKEALVKRCKKYTEAGRTIPVTLNSVDHMVKLIEELERALTHSPALDAVKVQEDVIRLVNHMAKQYTSIECKEKELDIDGVDYRDAYDMFCRDARRLKLLLTAAPATSPDDGEIKENLKEEDM